MSNKAISRLLVAIALATVPSCLGSDTSTPMNQPLVEASALAQRVAQQLTAQKPTLPHFAQPIDCTLGKDCFIMHYFDRDPGPDAVDFGCGRQTYNGHDGTDFAIPDEKTMAKGVAVKAVAPGKVLRVRDGVVDRRVADQTTKNQIEGIECGNGMTIDHGNGWEAQYCHLRNGSVAVKPGMQVEKGTVLGMVGESGLASFPHVHLTVRYQGKPVDPFVGPDAALGCNVVRTPLWEQPLDYVPTGLIRAGFSTQPPDENTLWEGRFSETTLPTNSPALLFWVQGYGSLQGDVQYFRLIAPDGKVVAEGKREVQSPSRSFFTIVGKKNTPSRPLTPGVWRAEYRLLRGARALIDLKREVELRF